MLVYSHCDPAAETLNPTLPLSAGFVPSTAKGAETLRGNMKGISPSCSCLDAKYAYRTKDIVMANLGCHLDRKREP